MRINSKKHLVGAAAGFLSVALYVSPVTSAETSAIPDLSGQWGRNMLNFEAPPSGPGPIVNSVRMADGTMDHDVPVGDTTNPILKPEAAEVLAQRGRISLSGRAFSSHHNQCWPEPPPFTLAMQYGMQLLQQRDEVVLVYLSDHKVRHIRLNEPHPADLTPTWQGDSVGHYEGDTLVIDTVGVRVGPLSAVDRYGTPHSEALHVIERYRLIDGEAAREAARTHENLYSASAGGVRDDDFHPYGRGSTDPDTEKTGLQAEITVEDPGAFTVPWSGFVTYRRIIGDWPEAVCAENAQGNVGMDSAVPTADTPDF